MPSESVKYGTFDLPVVAPEPHFGGSSAYNAGFGGEKLTIGLHTNDVPAQTSSGGASFFDCTVGTGGDYATVLDAYTAGKRNALLISDVTEVASSSGLSGMTIVGNLNGTSQPNAPYGCFSSLRTWLMYYTGGAGPVITVKNLNIDDNGPYSYGAIFSGYAENCSYSIVTPIGSSRGIASRCSVIVTDIGNVSVSEFRDCYINLSGTTVSTLTNCKVIACNVVGSGKITAGSRCVGCEIGCNLTSNTVKTSFSSCHMTGSASSGWNTNFSSCVIDGASLPSYSNVTGCTMGNMTGTPTNLQLLGCICGTLNITGTNCIIVGNQTSGVTVGGTGNVVANNI